MLVENRKRRVGEKKWKSASRIALRLFLLLETNNIVANPVNLLVSLSKVYLFSAPHMRRRGTHLRCEEGVADDDAVCLHVCLVLYHLEGEPALRGGGGDVERGEREIGGGERSRKWQKGSKKRRRELSLLVLYTLTRTAHTQ